MLFVGLCSLYASRYTKALSSCAYSQLFIFKFETIHRAGHVKVRQTVFNFGEKGKSEPGD